MTIQTTNSMITNMNQLSFKKDHLLIKFEGQKLKEIIQNLKVVTCMISLGIRSYTKT